MATNTNQMRHKDNTAMWVILAVIAAVVIGYLAYAAYYNTGYSSLNMDMTDNRINVPTTTTP